jgi:hypothetical protein
MSCFKIAAWALLAIASFVIAVYIAPDWLKNLLAVFGWVALSGYFMSKMIDERMKL